MPVKPNNYLVQLRDQMAKAYDLGELKNLAFELSLDWDELIGSRKTIRIQDLITQLARNGRLEELVELLQKGRPGNNWTGVPPAEQQRQDIRTAFPQKPLYQQTWVWASAIVLLAVIGISITTWIGRRTTDRINQLPSELAAAIPTDTPIPPPTITPTPSPTPLPFPPAAEDETLIVIATFYRAEGLLNAEVYNEIRRAIQANIDELDLGNNVQVKVEPTILRTENRSEAEALGNQYNASLIIWGEETSLRMEVSFLNLKEPDFDAAEATISETEKNQIASMSNPDAYSDFVLEELPGQFNFLSFFALGQTAYSQENYGEAIELLETAVAAISDSSLIDSSEVEIDDAYFRLGWLYQTTEQLQSAVAAYDQTIALNPEYTEAYNNRGIAFDNQGEFEQAIADYDQAIAINPKEASAFMNRGNAYAKQGEYEQALADYGRAIDLNPEYAIAFNNRGTAYFERGEYERAVAEYGQAIALNPEYNSAFNYRGLAYIKLGDYEQAIADLDQAIALNLEYADAYNNRGSAYNALGKYGQAISDLDQAIALNPEFVEAFTNLGHAYYGLGQYEESIAGFDQAIALNPEFSDAFYNRSIVYYALAEYAQAIADLDQAIVLNPEYANAFYVRGLVYQILGEYEKALADFKAHITLNPQTPFVDAWSNVCWFGSLLGAAEDVALACDKALSLSADAQAEAQNLDSRGLNKALRGDFSGAIADFQAFVDFFQDMPGFESSIEKRASWINSLNENQNPFDAETLEELLNE